MNIPDTIIETDGLARRWNKVNRIVDYLRSSRLKAGNGIRINEYSGGTLIESTAVSRGGTASAEGYTGMLRVHLVSASDGSETITVDDAGNPDSDTAGYAYYNLVMTVCPVKTGIAPAEGFLYLSIKDKTVDYIISKDLKNQPLDTSKDSTSYYPLAIVSGSASDGWKVRQIVRHTVPLLFAFSSCDSST